MKGKNLNDLWSAYRYGDKIKVVYHITGKRCDNPFKKSKLQQHYEELELIPIPDPEGDAQRFEQSLSRTRSTIFEIAMCNEFTHFCTFTADAEKRDRFDLKAFHKEFSQFIRDENKKRSESEKLRYLLIPEQHKDGAWHFHALFMGLGKKDLKKNEFGYLDWFAYRRRFGFFSCSKIKSHEACSKYITKYVTKSIASDVKRNAGQHLFYASQGLRRREVLDVLSGDKCPFMTGEKSEKWDFENEYVKIKWVNINPENGIVF